MEQSCGLRKKVDDDGEVSEWHPQRLVWRQDGRFADEAAEVRILLQLRREQDPEAAIKKTSKPIFSQRGNCERNART